MATYEEIYGKRVKELSADPTLDSSYEGQVWYNTGDGVLKSVVSFSAFISGGPLNTQRSQVAGAGTKTAGLSMGGTQPASTAPSRTNGNKTESYNGFVYTNESNSPLYKRQGSGLGTQTAAFVFGGFGIDPAGPQNGLSVTFTEEYDGTNFSAGDTLLQGANAPLGMSNSNKDDSTCAGGFDQAASARLSLTQNYNGTAWTTGASLGTARYAGTGGGSAAGGFVAAGSVPPNTNATEELTAETSALNIKTISTS